MQDLIKRYFWVLGGVVVVVGAVFAAKATSHVVEAKYLNDADHAPKLAALAPTPQVTKSVRSKDGTPFSLRNMFCAECTPPVETASNIDSSAVITTSLPLQLVATSVSIDDEESYATIINTENQKQGSYSIGDVIPGASPGILKEIHYKFVEFENAGHHERLGLNGAPPPVVAKIEQPVGEGSGDEMQNAIDNGIKKIDDNHYEIDKALVDKVLANPMGVAKGARVVPAVKDGKPDGFKLYAIRPSSVYSKLGLQNGDTLQSINGFDLTSADKALEVYTKLREATSLQVTITRRGKQEQLGYSIR
ncbi:MAG: type II secretion system protein GspC [Kofleriaceae bacterium]